MGCDHTGPEDVIRAVEAELEKSGEEPANWDGLRFGWGENVETMWRSIYIEIVRRDGAWVVTRLDRNHDPLDNELLGLREMPEGA